MDINHWNLVGSSVSPNSFPNMAYRNIHVLLVEHDSRERDNIINLLHYFSYRVTTVKLLSTAFSTLSKGKVQFDLVMVNMNSPDSYLELQLLQDAAKMKLLVIFMSNVDDVVTTVRSLEQGAFLCMRKPLSMAVLGDLWQFVLSEKSRRPKETEPFTKLIDNYNYNSQEKVIEKYILESNYQSSSNTNFEEKDTTSNGGKYKKKAWAEWTLDLHRKFMAAAKSLGQGKCYPKEILEIMNVPGLTRMQVASHLQKCRHAKWLPPNERKLKAANRENTPKKESKPPRVGPLRFGVMPFWEEDSSEFPQAIQEYNEDVKTNPPVLGHDDHGFYTFDSDNFNMGLDQQFVFGDYNQSVAPLTNFSPNLITEDPFELLPIMDSEMVDEFPNFQQDFEMDLDDDWEAFLLDGGKHDQVCDAVKKGSHDASNPDI